MSLSSMFCIPLLLGLLLQAFAVTIAPNASLPGLVVDLGYAKYRGIHNATFGANAFFGIRYAAPPQGDLRFRAPLDIESYHKYSSVDIIDATEWGPQCIQGTPGWSKLPAPTNSTVQTSSEDCLRLDVLVPDKPTNASLPVWVMLPGGGYTQAYAERYPGWALLQASKGNLIYVTPQYRLNAFGFLTSEEVRADGDANAGLLDQRSALQWVQRHIRSFGGDPTRVTLVGNSAGGGSVLNQLIMYGGEDRSPPFSRAIAEYPWWQPYHNETILEAQYQDVLAAANCSSLACLRSVSMEVLTAASQYAQTIGYTADDGQPTYYGYGDYYYGPSVDGKTIQDLPSNELKHGHFSKMPLLVDHDGYEGDIFSNTSETMFSEVLDLEQLFPAARPSFFQRLFQLYPESAFNSTFWQRQQVFGDAFISCPTYYMATAFADAGMPTWKLIYNAGTEVHGASVPSLYMSEPSKMGNLTIAHIMKDWYLGFAVFGDPNRGNFGNGTKPYWQGYSDENNINENRTGGNAFSVMTVNYTMFGNVADPDASAQCDFLHGQSWAVGN